jgi:deazaflavin-dependent oxidoreductase (nitroreductase family)
VLFPWSTATLGTMSDMNDFNQSIIDEFRANDGVVGGPFAGAPVVILHTTGAKSGKARVNPLVTQPGDDGTLYIFASKAGAPDNPDWYHNLLAHPEVEIEIGTEHFGATATEVTGDERDRIYTRQKELMPGFADYEAKTTRTIPVIALTRSGS